MNLSQSPAKSRSIFETTLVILALCGLIFTVYDVLKLFFGVFTFALIFFIACGSLFELLAKRLRNRKLAAVVYSIVLIAVIALPFIFMIGTLLNHAKDLAHWIGNVRANGVPPMPAWIKNIPFLNEELERYWKEMQAKPSESLAVYETHLRNVLHHLLHTGAGLLGAAIEFIAGIIFSVILLFHKSKFLLTIRTSLMYLLGKEYAESLMVVTGNAIRGVAIGVMGTAFIAAFISWVGFAIAAVPFKFGLAVLVFLLVMIQVGPLPVWLGVIIWTFSEGETGWGIFLVIYAVFVFGIDAILKPVLIAKTGKLPFLVLFLGTIGGIAAWGFTGIFKGAIILAIFYTVFDSWLTYKNKQSRMETITHGLT